jgi:hypothetical protein
MKGDEDKPRASGCDHYVTKPYSPVQLMRIIFPEVRSGDNITSALLLDPGGDGRYGSKAAVTWGSVRAFQLVSSTPMNRP